MISYRNGNAATPADVLVGALEDEQMHRRATAVRDFCHQRSYTAVPAAEHELWHPNYLAAIKSALDRMTLCRLPHDLLSMGHRIVFLRDKPGNFREQIEQPCIGRLGSGLSPSGVLAHGRMSGACPRVWELDGVAWANLTLRVQPSSRVKRVTRKVFSESSYPPQ
jgi:hypothetical protein